MPPDPPSKSRLRRSKWALSRPYCQYSELYHARASKQKKARNVTSLVTNSKNNSNKLNNTADRNLLANMHIMRGLPLTIQPWLNPNYSPICILSYSIPRIIARDLYFFFHTKMGRLFEGGNYFMIKCCFPEVVP